MALVEEMPFSTVENIRDYSEIAKIVKSSTDFYPSDSVRIAADTLEAETGIIPDMYVSFYGEKAVAENSYDRFIIVETKDGNKQEVKKLFTDYMNRIKRDASQIDSLKISSGKVGEYNDFVIFSLLGTDSNKQYEDKDEAKRSYTDMNLRVLEISVQELESLYGENNNSGSSALDSDLVN
jgi:hypothetical protein